MIWSLEASLVCLVVMLPCLVSKRRFVGSSMAFVWGDVAWHASRDIRTQDESGERISVVVLAALAAAG